MPVQPNPKYWKSRKRYGVWLHGHQYMAPMEIREGDLAALAEWWDAIRRKTGAALEPTAGLTLGELARRYIDWDARRVAAGRRDRDSHDKVISALKRVCLEPIGRGDLGETRADRLAPQQLEGLILDWTARHSPGYARALAIRLKAAYAWAAREGLIRSNPIASVKKPPEPVAEERYASEEEAQAWLAWLETSPVNRDYVMLQKCLIFTGARPSEWTRATVGELDTSSWILVRRKWKNLEKQRKARRVFVPTPIRQELSEHIEGKGPDELIFTNTRGRQWLQGRLSGATCRLRRLAIADGVQVKDDGPDRLTNYRWRHTAATALIQDGVPIATVAELLGTSVHQLSRTYAHLQAGHLAEHAESLARRKWDAQSSR